MVAKVKRSTPATRAQRRQVVGHKGGGKKQRQPSIASNSVPSISTARLVYLWSWGPIVGPVSGLRSVKLDGTPIIAEDGTINYPGVKWQFRSGELHQDRLEGVTESSNEIQVGLELRSNVPWVYSINNAVIDAVRVRFSWPVLQAQDSGGNINGVHIAYAIDVATDGGPYQQMLASSVDRKNVTKYERSHRIELPAGSRWTIRARRLTPEANSSLVQDAMVVEAIAEVVNSDQEYPLTAVGCVEYDAQQFGGDFPKIAVLMRGRIVRVPMNYDPEARTYATSGAGTTNGVWDGSFKEAYTNNPAWVFYDLALHPYYGLGDRIDASMINRWSLYRIAQWCDQLVPDGKGQGGMEPRFTCNLYLQKQAEAWAVLQDLAAIFHGLAYWDGSQITVNADIPQDPVYTYTPSQILGDGAIKYSGSRLRDRHSLAMVSFDDPDQGFDTDKEPVFDEDAMAEYGVRSVSVEAVGCTSRGQAQRAGKWALLTEQLQIRGATINVGLDGYIPKPGTVIALSDPLLAGRANGGRIAAVAGRVVTLDRDAEVPIGARLLVNLPSGNTETRQVRSVAGRQITVVADYSEPPQPECGWAIDYDDLKLMQFYVRNVTRPEWTRFQLELIQHEPSKFDAIDHGTMIDDRPISVLPPGVQEAPARVLISSHSAVDQGIAVTTMTIGWDAAPGAVAYDVEWRWGSRDWIKVPRTGELAVDVRGVYAGQYLARVRAVSAMNVSSIPTTSVLTNLEGKTGLPPAVTQLIATSELFGIGLKWGFPAGAEDTQRTEIWYGPGNSLEQATKLTDLAYPQSDYGLQGLAAGARFFFWARLVDRTGNVGPFYPAGSGVMGQASADAGPILDLIKEKVDESIISKELNERIDLVDGDGPGSVNDRINQAVKDITDALVYDPAKAYAKGDVVRLGQKIYQAQGPVAVGVAPPAEPWQDIATILEEAGALAGEVHQNTLDISELDGVVTAQAEKVDGVFVQLNPLYSGDTGSYAGDNTTSVGVWSVWSAIGEGDYAQGKRTDRVEVKVGENTAAITTLSQAVIDGDRALAEQITTVGVQVGENTAAVQAERQARIDADGALGREISTVQTNLNGATAAIAENKEAIQDVDGKVSLTWSVRLQYTSATGEYKWAGVGLGLENGPGGLQSKFVIDADMFAIQQGGIVPFAVEGGQVFMRSAFIQDGSIDMLKIGSNLQSSNYVPNESGWAFLPDGTFQMMGNAPGGARLMINNKGLFVFHPNGVKAIDLSVDAT
ncbi:host specificity protein [Pseudomonas protegens]|uniref:TipJ family phage tail tip protein n=1 Tax=Pseudomonas protegens TaxID=380021 RepID=UPI000C9C423B|nr:phage tail protein [Pseudomonas protegens]PNG28949.1 host specificity protein [Pseudomonas protegens]